MRKYPEPVTDVRASRHAHPRETPAQAHVALMADLFGMLSDRSRLRILLRLRASGEACVTELAGSTGITESAVSHALRLLRAHGIVDTRRDGRWIYYTLVDPHVELLLDATVEHLEREHGTSLR
jgi:DNA-binding transcriptional ArsR family regulator